MLNQINLMHYLRAKRIALIRSYAEAYVGNERMRGVEEELARSGADVVAEYRGDFNYDRGVAAILDWAQRGITDYDAVIAANDMMAWLQALTALKPRAGFLKALHRSINP